MRRIHFIVFFFLLSVCAGPAKGQSKASDMKHVLTDPSSKMTVASYDDGRYAFTFADALSKNGSACSIVVKNKKDAQDFVGDIKKAFNLKENQKDKADYGGYHITLLPSSIGGVFMIAEKGDHKSAFTIPRGTATQIDVIR